MKKTILLASLFFSLLSYATAQIPTANLQRWYKADVGVYTDAGITPAQDGQLVQQWNDMSGRSAPNNATQLDVGSKPTLIRNFVLNGKPVLRFNGNNTYLSYDGSAVVGTAYTIFVVEGRTSNKQSNYFMGGTSTGIYAQNQNLVLGYRYDTTVTLAQYINDLDAKIPAFQSQKFCIRLLS
jgi:hypothetical protein